MSDRINSLSSADEYERTVAASKRFLGINSELPHPEIDAAHTEKVGEIKGLHEDLKKSYTAFFGAMGNEGSSFGEDAADLMDADNIAQTRADLTAYKDEESAQIEAAEQSLKEFYENNQRAVQEYAPIVMNNDLINQAARQKVVNDSPSYRGGSSNDEEEG